MRVLIVGDCEADYLARCHEAFRTGLREVCGARPFGRGYPGFDPALRTYDEIAARVFPEGAPDVVIAAYDLVDGRIVLPYAGLERTGGRRAIVLGDFWNATGARAEAFVADLERHGIDRVLCYFPQALAAFAHTRCAERFVHLLPCFDPRIFHAWTAPKRFDVGFLAAGTTEPSPFYPERAALHRRLLARRDLRYLWAPHPGWERRSEPHPLVGEEFSRAIGACRLFVTTAGVHRTPNPKYVEILASGAALVAEEPDDAGALRLEDGVNYIRITPENALERIDYYLARPHEIERIARAGVETAQRHHSCTARAREFVALLDGRDELGLPRELVEDDNHPQPIALPPSLPELPISSSPQYTLYRLIRRLRPRRILEIGTQIGASAVAMALAQRDNGSAPDVTCVDPFLPTGDNDGLDSLALWYRNVRRSGVGDGIGLVMSTSQQALPRMQPGFDFIVVDGSHAYEDVRYDLDASARLCARGGYVWCHDYVIYESVRRACDEAFASHRLPFAVNRIQRNDRGDLCGWAICRNLPGATGAHETGGPVRLRLGGGSERWPGYRNVDLLDVDRAAAPGSVREAVLIHSLNALSLWDARELFRKLFALLESDGKVVIETVNLERAIAQIREHGGDDEVAYLEGVRALHGFGWDDLEARAPFQPNRMSWSPWHLALELERAGFAKVELLPPTRHSPWRDMRIEAVRPASSASPDRERDAVC